MIQNDHDKISVSTIITAYNRIDFCFEAILSVLNQQDVKWNCEIIVIKNFYEKRIDNLISENNVISIFKDNCSIGEMLREAIARSRGEIICFLDDDDLFMPNKIEHVISIFKETNNLNYYHHSQEFRDIDLIPFMIQERSKSFYEKFVLQACDVEEEFLNLRKKHITISSLFFNLSSIVIRKKIIADKLDLLSMIRTHPDDFMFISALAYNPESVLIHENLNLIIYRSHESLSNARSGIKGMRAVYQKDIESSLVVLSLCKVNPFLQHIMNLRISYEKYIYSILNWEPKAMMAEFRTLTSTGDRKLLIRRNVNFYFGTPILYALFVLIGKLSSWPVINEIVNKIITKIV
ncbi:MAG: glycosyltransferase family 2 protein [Thermoplasmatales archaeon]